MEKPLTKMMRPDGEPLSLGEYEAAGGYQALRKALGAMTPTAVVEEVKKSNLRGRGGAGFPTGLKWGFMPKADRVRRPRYFVVNADEMEPGTWKDRMLMEGNPHQVVEGALLGAYAVEADVGYIFLRAEYAKAARVLRRAIAEAYGAGYAGKNVLGSGWALELSLHISAGRYMCGEEMGLINALEGRRANPRNKPPHPQLAGLWGLPTIVSNTETVCNAPHIILNGAEWYKGISRSSDGGTKIYGASGKVKRPGLWELPMGTPLREVLEEHAGGMRDGLKFRGVLPGGASTDFLGPEHLDVKMDFDSVPKAGSRMGTGTMIILDDHTCPVGMVRNLERFFARESCGWCTPCRDGLPWAAQVLDAIEEGRGEPGDLDVLADLCRLMAPGHTYCALAAGAVEPLQSALKLFREEFERHIRDKRCPWR